jgi:hypothetical protein
MIWWAAQRKAPAKSCSSSTQATGRGNCVGATNRTPSWARLRLPGPMDEPMSSQRLPVVTVVVGRRREAAVQCSSSSARRRPEGGGQSLYLSSAEGILKSRCATRRASCHGCAFAHHRRRLKCRCFCAFLGVFWRYFHLYFFFKFSPSLSYL